MECKARNFLQYVPKINVRWILSYIYVYIANFMKWRFGKEVGIFSIRTSDRYTKFRTIIGHLHWLMGLVIQVRFLTEADTLFWAPHTTWPQHPRIFLLGTECSFLKSTSRGVKMIVYLLLGQRIRTNGDITPFLYTSWRGFFFFLFEDRDNLTSLSLR